MPEQDRVQLASFTLENEADEWFHWMHENKLITTCETFVNAIKLRFGPSQFEDYQGKLSK